MTAPARDFRVAQVPNGASFNCQNCHFSPFGGGLRNNFGNAVFAKIGGTSASIAFWDASLAAADSDGDGFTNGQELGDEDGDGIPERTTGISNPGDASSVPTLPKSPPAFTSTPVTVAIKGESYSYLATATDGETAQNALTFAKVAGPAWLAVSSTGLVSGTPPDDHALAESVTLRVVAAGSPPMTTDQSYVITLTATFAGWVKHHHPPGTSPGAVAGADVDDDAIPELLEFALRGDPAAATPFEFLPTAGVGQAATFTVDIRDDAPALEVVAETSDTVSFGSPALLSPAVSDPTPGDGRKRLTFTDTVTPTGDTRRFIRLKFSHP